MVPLRPPPPGKLQVAKGVLRNTGTDPLEKQFDPRVKLLLGGGSYDPLRITLTKVCCQDAPLDPPMESLKNDWLSPISI